MHAPAMSAIATELVDARATFLAYIRRRIADPELAEDILQDSLLRAIQAAPGVRDEERLVPWFYTILQHAIVDAYRRRDVERRHVAVAEVEEPGVEPEEVDDAVLCACVHTLIPALKPAYADLVRSLELAGETPEAAMQRLGVTPTNLKVRRHRARQALRRGLEQLCGACAEHHCLDCSCRRS